MPKVVQSLIASFGEADVNTDDITRKLASDQVLTAKVLRMANSVHYGAQRKIASVNDAVVLLGFDAVRTLVLASGLTSTLTAPEGFDIKQFWRNSFDMAAVCKWLASFTALNRETAFTCGMMHNIGGLIIHIIAPEEAEDLDTIGTADPWLFTELGSALAERWHFPSSICHAIRHQLAPGQAAIQEPLAYLLFLANYIEATYCSSPEAVAQNMPELALAKLHISQDALMAKLVELESAKGRFDALLS